MNQAARGAEPDWTEKNPPFPCQDEEAIGRSVQSMFDRIAPRYDLLNHVLSANIDRTWWRRTAATFEPILQNPNSVVLDMCCGTGDMTLALLRHRPPNAAPMLALDFSHEMLQHAKDKFRALAVSPSINLIEADALRMPVADSSVDLITTAFGFRNLANYEAGLREMLRVMRPGAEVGILDFSQPKGIIGPIYSLYFRYVLPRIGKFISGSSAPYTYLPHSVQRFPKPDELLATMQACGFIHVTWTPYTFGIAGLYRAVKA